MFAHVVLVDELNRTPPRTQSALLETMEEQQVSVDGQTWPLPHPHLVIATQNPRSQRGTFPLVESQLDRFAIATSIGYPDADNEAQLAVHQAGKFALAELTPVCTTERWRQAQAATESVLVTSAIAQYAVQLCRATRAAPGVRLGASPRAAIWLIRCAQAHAVLSARNFVAPDDVKAVAVGCLAHRILTDEWRRHLRCGPACRGRHSRGDGHSPTMRPGRPGGADPAGPTGAPAGSDRGHGGDPRGLVAGGPQQRRRMGAGPRRRGVRDARHRHGRSRGGLDPGAGPGYRGSDRRHGRASG